MTDAPSDIAKGFLPYNREAPELRVRYAARPFGERHSFFRDHFPQAPSRILDVGAGIGVDARGFADLGHDVVAVEPADEMREVAMSERDHENITWISDYLPSLESVVAMEIRFDFILAMASFMHLGPDHQSNGFATLAGLLEPGAHLAMALRHGPVPQGRTMYEISPDTATTLAKAVGLDLLVAMEGLGRKEVPDVTWSHLVFAKEET